MKRKTLTWTLVQSSPEKWLGLVKNSPLILFTVIAIKADKFLLVSNLAGIRPLHFNSLNAAKTVAEESFNGLHDSIMFLPERVPALSNCS